jgi:inorganic pyrophosphatase
MVLEIPQHKLAKFEASYKLKYNPLVQDKSKHPLDSTQTIPRFYKFFPVFNYGFMP